MPLYHEKQLPNGCLMVTDEPILPKVHTPNLHRTRVSNDPR